MAAGRPPQRLAERIFRPTLADVGRWSWIEASVLQSVPFDTEMLFSTNMHPLDLADEAFLRRIGYKI